MLALLNESFTTTITRERVELALGRKFARFSNESKSDAILDMGKTWYFNVKHSESHGVFEVRGIDQGHGVFSNGALLFDPFVAQSLEGSGWVQFQHMYTAGLHGEPIPWVGISYRRKGKEVFFDLIDGKHVTNFGIALNRTKPDRPWPQI